MKKKYGVDGHGDVRCFIDEEEVDCETFKEVPVDLEAEEWIRKQSYGGSAETWLKTEYFLYFYCQPFKAMTLTTKFKKDLSTLRAAANKELFLDVKNPKLYKKVLRYYQNEIDYSEDDHELNYSLVVECLKQDLNN